MWHSASRLLARHILTFRKEAQIAAKEAKAAKKASSRDLEDREAHHTVSSHLILDFGIAH